MEYDGLIEKKNILDKLKLSAREVQELIVAWLLLSMVFVGFTSNQGSSLNLELFFGLILVFGSAFIFHELAHKYAAIKMGGQAEFRIDSRGMMITIFSMLIGFPLLMPGAVFWRSEYGRYSNIRGIVSAAGPLTNMTLAGVFLTLLPLTGFLASITSDINLASLFYLVIYSGFRINIFLGLFNLIPVWILDGKKVLDSSTTLWLVIVIGYLGMYMFSRAVFGFTLGLNLGFLSV